VTIPKAIGRNHVLEAMDRIGLDQSMWPARSQSTQYDIVDPRNGGRFPPKLVLSVAAQIATGKELPRRSFGGGAETNKRLKALRFEIVPKYSNEAIYTASISD
jgi:hypothetical protein